MITLGTGIGSALIVDGALVPNTELGHLPLHDGDAEDWAADSVREQEELSSEVRLRLQAYLELVERILWPSLIVIGGGVSKRASNSCPHRVAYSGRPGLFAERSGHRRCRALCPRGRRRRTEG